MQTIKQLLGTDGITLENLKETSQNAPLGKGWDNEDFTILAEMLIFLFPQEKGPSTVIYIVERFIRERSRKAKFESIWFLNFLTNVFSGLERYCNNIDEMQYVRITKIVSDVLGLWTLERNDSVRLELYQAIAAMFEQIFIKKYLQIPQKLSEYIKATMLFNLSDEYLPDKSLAKKIVYMILRRNQTGPVQVNGYKLLQLIHFRSRQKAEIFANYSEFKALLEKKISLFQLCHKLNSLQGFDTIAKVIIKNKEHSNVHISFQRKLGMIMVLFQDSDEYDYYPINRHQISSAMLMQNDYEIIARMTLDDDEKIQFIFAKNTRFCGERIETLIRREGPFFFNVGTSTKESNLSSVRSMPISERKELRSVVDEDGETQNTIDSSQSSTFFRSQITRLNAGVTPGPNVSIKAPSRKMFQSDSHSTLAPLNRGLKTQLKLRETPRNAKNTKSSRDNRRVTGGASRLMTSAKKDKQEMHLTKTPMKTTRGKKKDLPPPQLDTSSESDSSVSTGSTLFSQEVKPNVSETVTEEQLLVQQLKEEFASVCKLMPRMQEGINEIQSVKNQVDESCKQHKNEWKKARKNLKKTWKESVREDKKKAAGAEKKMQIATMAQELMKHIVREVQD